MGNVRDANTTLPVNRASVTDGLGNVATSFPTPEDPDVEDGLFILFSEAGNQTLTATGMGYGEDQEDVTVIKGSAVVHGRDFLLPAGSLIASPTDLRVTARIGKTPHRRLVLTNVGGNDAGFSFEDHREVEVSPRSGIVPADGGQMEIELSFPTGDLGLPVGGRFLHLSISNDTPYGPVLIQVLRRLKPPLCNGLEATVIGTEGPDTLTGTRRDDVIVGLAGDDSIRGLGGDDTICAGPGLDIVRAGGGDDWASGDAGPDFVAGGPGNDTLYGRSGIDNLKGGAGKDTIVCGPGPADVALGGPGRDTATADCENTFGIP